MSRLPLETYLDGSYAEEVTVRITEDDELVYAARYSRLPDCATEASSADEALAALRRQKERYIQSLFEAGSDIPEPDFPGEPSVSVGSVVVVSPKGLPKHDTIPTA